MGPCTRLRRNTEGQSTKHFRHYDPAIPVRAVLDDTYYSSRFSPTRESLEAASHRKLARICEQLDLQADRSFAGNRHRLGGMALYASAITVSLPTTTISASACARQRGVAQAGLSDRGDGCVGGLSRSAWQYDKWCRERSKTSSSVPGTTWTHAPAARTMSGAAGDTIEAIAPQRCTRRFHKG